MAHRGGRKKVCARGGSLEPLSEPPPPPPLRAPVTETISTPPNPPPTVVVLMSGHFQPHPMAQRKMEDVVPRLGLPLAQTTRMQMSNLTHQRNWNRKQNSITSRLSALGNHPLGHARAPNFPHRDQRELVPVEAT